MNNEHSKPTPEDLECCIPVALDPRTVKILKLLSTRLGIDESISDSRADEILSLFIHNQEQLGTDSFDLKDYLKTNSIAQPFNAEQNPQVCIRKQYSKLDPNLNAWDDSRTRSGFINGFMFLLYHNDQYYVSHIKNIKLLDLSQTHTWIVGINFVHKATLNALRPMSTIPMRGGCELPISEYTVGYLFMSVMPEYIIDEVIQKTLDIWIQNRLGGFLD